MIGAGIRSRDFGCDRFADCSDVDTSFCSCYVVCSEEFKDEL